MAKDKREIYVYEWQGDGKVLGYGVTRDLDARKTAHKYEEPASRIEVVEKSTEEAHARARGKEMIKAYVKKNGELPPKNRPRRPKLKT